MAIFFANQGSSFDILREQHYLFTSPLDRTGKRQENYAALGQMQPGDTVIINVDGLAGVATVRASRDGVPMAADFAAASNAWDAKRGMKDGFWKPGVVGRRVDVEYEEFDGKIRYQDWKEELLSAQAQCPSKRQPFASNGAANQGTFYWLDTVLARVLMRIVGRPVPQMYAPAPGGKGDREGEGEGEGEEEDTSGPYVAQFTSREVRPEQGAFRDRMFDIWKKCPVTGTVNPGLLDAAHFENWRERNDERAGMLLNTLIHRAIDRDIMKLTLHPNGKEWLVKVLVKGDRLLDGYDGMTFTNPLALRGEALVP